MMSIVQQRMQVGYQIIIHLLQSQRRSSSQVTEDRIMAIEGRRRPQANPDQSTRDWLSANHEL